MTNFFSNIRSALLKALAPSGQADFTTESGGPFKANQASETFVLEPTAAFSEIMVSSIMSVEVALGKSLTMTLTCPAHLKSKVEISVRGKCLTVDTVGNFQHKGDTPIVLRIETPTLLRKAASDGAAELTLRDVLASESELSSGGASKLSALGRCETLRIHAEGASEVNAVNVNSVTVNARSEGASKIKFKAGVAKSDAIADGASGIKVYGKSPVSRLRASLAASVKEKV